MAKLGYSDSNRDMRKPKSRALPFGDTPKFYYLITLFLPFFAAKLIFNKIGYIFTFWIATYISVYFAVCRICTCATTFIITHPLHSLNIFKYLFASFFVPIFARNAKCNQIQTEYRATIMFFSSI